MSGDENELLELLAARLRLGRARYGALDVRADQRDYEHEALEELLDAVIYLAAALVRRRGAEPRG